MRTSEHIQLLASPKFFTSSNRPPLDGHVVETYNIVLHLTTSIPFLSASTRVSRVGNSPKYALCKLGACRFGWVEPGFGCVERGSELGWSSGPAWMGGTRLWSSTLPLLAICDEEDGISPFANRPEDNTE